MAAVSLRKRSVKVDIVTDPRTNDAMLVVPTCAWSGPTTPEGASRMPVAMGTRRFWRTRDGVRAVLIAGALFLTYAFFYQAGGWNQNSRFDLVRAVVDRGTPAIDAYEHNTGDKARRAGHTYC